MQNLTGRFVELIDQQLKALNTNAFAVEQAHGLPPDSIRNVLRSEKRSGPTLAKTEEICKALGLEIVIRPHTLSRDFPEADGVTPRAFDGTNRPGHIPIPWHLEAKRTESCPIGFSGDWLDKIGVVPGDLAAVMPDFVELEGAISKNTVALLETLSPRRGSSEVWCYKMAGQLRVARFAFTEKVTVVLPKNANEAPAIYDKVGSKKLHILGKVIWLGGFA